MTARRPLAALLSAWSLFTCFTFYVTFVQYALLGRAASELGLAERDLTPGFGLLAIGGIAGSLFAGWWIDRCALGLRRLFRATGALSLMLVAAGWLALQAGTRRGLNLSFAPMGVVLGLTIVVLLTQFLRAVPAASRGWYAGWTTGLVYLIANVQACFVASPRLLGLVDVALVLSNVVLLYRFAPNLSDEPATAIGVEATVSGELQRLAPLALVVLADTALFVNVSRAAGSSVVFAGPAEWLANGAGHLTFAVAAGIIYRRWGWRRLTALAGVALALTAAVFWLHQLGHVNLSTSVILLYSLSVGAYTVALFSVFADEVPRQSPAWGVAVGMVLVGWLASPAGIALGTKLLGAR